MKQEHLDIEALLSQVAACLATTHLEIEKAKLEEAREQPLNLAEVWKTSSAIEACPHNW